MLGRLFDWFIATSKADRILAVATTVLVALVGGASWLPHVSYEARLSGYQALAGVGGALLGFTLTAVTLVLTRDAGRRSVALMAEHGTTIHDAMFAGIRGQGAATAAALLAYVFDGGASSATWAVRALVTFGATFGALRTVRVIYVMGTVLTFRERDERAGVSATLDSAMRKKTA
jgi:hypothetical protein